MINSFNALGHNLWLNLMPLLFPVLFLSVGSFVLIVFMPGSWFHVVWKFLPESHGHRSSVDSEHVITVLPAVLECMESAATGFYLSTVDWITRLHMIITVQAISLWSWVLHSWPPATCSITVGDAKHWWKKNIEIYFCLFSKVYLLMCSLHFTYSFVFCSVEFFIVLWF